MSKEITADAQFQVWLERFYNHFGIVNPEDFQTQAREIIPEFVQIDAVVAFPNNFDFTTLSDKVFPFLGKDNGFEYKGENDPLSVMRLYQYSFTELGLITTYFLSKERKDRKERDSLSQKGAREQWQRLKAQGAMHSCCTVILSTTDPMYLRKEVGFEKVSDYPHLDGALYRLILSENKFVGSIATYLVVLKHLPIHPKNAPLLLLSKGKKLEGFCRWLLEDGAGITAEERYFYLLYLLLYHLIQNKEIVQEMSKKLLLHQPVHYDWIFDTFDRGSEEAKTDFLEQVHKRMLHADTPLEVAQKALQADSPLEASQKLLQANSPEEVAQKALQANSPLEASQKLLQANSPEEAALKFIQSEEQVNRLIELFQERKLALA